MTTLRGPDGRSADVDIIRETAAAFVVREGAGEAEYPKAYWSRPVAVDAEPQDRDALKAWFLAALPTLPREPFQLFPWVFVSDPDQAYARWHAILIREPGAQTDGAYRDIGRLRAILTDQ